MGGTGQGKAAEPWEKHRYTISVTTISLSLDSDEKYCMIEAVLGYRFTLP